MSKRWDHIIGNVTEAHPSPVSVRDPVSSALNRRSSRLTQNRIGQSLAVIEDVVTSSTDAEPSFMTTPTTHRTAKQKRNEDTPTGMITLMDRTGAISNYPTLNQPTDITMMNLTNLPMMDQEHSFNVTHQHTLSTLNNSTTIVPSNTKSTLAIATTNEDPLRITIDDLLRSFHNALSTHSSSGEVLELISELSKYCTLHINELREFPKSNSLSDKISELSMERDTWTLMDALYSDRLAGEGGVADMEVNDDELGSDKEIVDKYFEVDRDVREAQMVVDWLETISCNKLHDFPLKVKYFADSVSWENTIHDIQQGINKNTIVTEVDPDAPVRQNRKLSELDESDELSLCKHLFKCVKAGQLDKARELCIQCGQSWRAATLDGWKLYHDPNMDKEVGDELEPIEGNCGRTLWKYSCWEMANCVSYNKHERALYASLCGNIAQLLPVCQTWYDCVWAYYKVMVDVLVEQRLSVQPAADSDLSIQLPEDYWKAILVPDLIFQEIESISLLNVPNEAMNMYHQVQKHLILGDLESLVNYLHSLKDKHVKSVHHLRFMTHVVLFIKTISADYDESKCNDIIVSFINTLSCDYHELVALYTSYLTPELQVSCYSRFLRDIYGIEKQRNCLELAVKSGLDVTVITRNVVEEKRLKIMESQPSLDINNKELSLSEEDAKNIEVLNWLLFYEDQRNDAVHQANAMMRMYLAVRKHSAAFAVFNKLPEDTPTIVQKQWEAKAGQGVPLSSDIENDLAEYLSMKAYLEAITSFNNWFVQYHTKNRHIEAPPLTPPPGCSYNVTLDYDRHLQLYKDTGAQLETVCDQLAEAAEGKITNVLLFTRRGWLVDIDGDSGDEGRRSQMKFLRQLCIPYLCVLLHTIHHNSSRYEKCLELADIIASEDHKIYSEFGKNELKQFLSLIQSSATELLHEDEH